MSITEKIANSEKITKKLSVFAEIWVSVGFIIIGLVFALIGAKMLTAPAVETAETTATIVGTVAPVYEDDVGYTIISYREQDGTEHRNVEYSAYASWWKPGDEIEITYEVDNPENVSGTAPRWIMPAAAMVIGTVMLGVSSVRLAKWAWRRQGQTE